MFKRKTKFEKAYIALYNERITINQFPKAAGLEPEEALRQLKEYRDRIMRREIPDPRGGEY